MNNLSSVSVFTFNGVSLTTGDHVVFRAASIPLPHVEAAFTDVDEDGRMHVFSTLLAPFRHSGAFSPEEVTGLMVVRKGAEAVLLGARRDPLTPFQHGQKVSCRIDDRNHIGELIAAFDGILCAWNQEVGFISGGSHFFSPA
jgi:hypothetical protein